jgi:ribosome-associated heat shock protein Hsp15
MPRGRSSTEATSGEHAVRIDKWLWAARFYKTRSLATQAIDAGHVRVNDQRCKPGRNAQIGDRVVINLVGDEREILVRAVSALRGPAPVAQCLYDETPASIERRAQATALRKLTPEAKDGLGRPSKRDRRELQRWKANTD